MSRRQSCMKFILMLSNLPLLIGERITSNNTLKQGDTLKYYQAIRSPSSNFYLAFFAEGLTDKKYYLGIFQKSVPVWVANRETPLLDDSGVLIIDNNGTFMITHSAGNPIVLYSDDGAAGSTRIAKLYDNGNLVFFELDSDSSVKYTLWQSFHYPTDTLLPEMLLGTVDETSRRTISLTSWLSSNNASSGAFTLDWNHMEQQMVLRRRGVIVWTSGMFKDGTFQYLPKDCLQEYTPVVRAGGSCLSFVPINAPSYFKLDEEGSLLYQTHNDSAGKVYQTTMKIMNMCYGYNSNHGCVEWSQPKCRSNVTIFEERNVLFYKADSNEIDLGSHYDSASVGPGDCRASCWEDCDCVAYRYADDSGCLLWKGKFHLEVHYGDHILPSYVISKALPRIHPQNRTHRPTTEGHFQMQNTIGPGRKRNSWIWIALSYLVIQCLLIVIYCWRWKRKAKSKICALEERKEKQLVEDITVTISIHKDVLESDLKLFNLHCLSEATNQFSQENKLGEGGFGPVFKGTLPEGREIAVKRLARSSGQGLEEFRNELKLVANLQHVNLVRLLGYCIQEEEKILVYEYMPNKSLDSFLFDTCKRDVLDYERRLKIIEGIAQGLHYLHELSRLRIIHRDLKAGNVLLDESLNPKISDFGMARIFKRNELMANTKRIVGTYGYVSPEYAMEGIFSVKSDVFSFGILVLEIVSGRRNNSFYHLDGHINLIGYAWELWQKDAWVELIDPTLIEASPMNQIRRMIHVGLLCVEDSPSNRPTVSDIISMLTNESKPLPLVKRPAFLFSLNTNTNQEYCHSISGLSLSSMAAR